MSKSRALRRETRYALVLSQWLEMEAERRESVHGLWEDYQFVVKKLGFAWVRLVLPDGANTWQAAGFETRAGNLLRVHHELSRHSLIEFAAEENVLPQKLFELLAELAAETWHKAALRWQELNNAPLEFTSVGIRDNHFSPGKCIPFPTPVGSESESGDSGFGARAA